MVDTDCAYLGVRKSRTGCGWLLYDVYIVYFYTVGLFYTIYIVGLFELHVCDLLQCSQCPIQTAPVWPLVSYRMIVSNRSIGNITLTFTECGCVQMSLLYATDCSTT